MPFYEYECANCKFYKEVMQKVSDAPLKKCPSCGKNALKKLVSAPVFRLKGAGWYETDFKSDKEKKRNLAEKDSDKKDAGESKPEAKDAKSDAKPEKAAEGAAKDAKASESKPTAETKSSSESTSQRRGTKPARKSAKAAAKPKPPARKKRR